MGSSKRVGIRFVMKLEISSSDGRVKEKRIRGVSVETLCNGLQYGLPKRPNVGE